MTRVQVGEGGEIAIPLELRQAVGIEGRGYVAVERVGGIITVRPINRETEQYTPQRKAEFLLSTAVDGADYAAAVQIVRAMGLDPDQIPHRTPAGV